ncbi:MAG: polysaccharide biosynthesis transport protein [Blastocatellia bacterium]|jgi:capsular exopolysaccharide synthesis family protein|nr:polysaccharide biosynthesis transport protein [Blastocatellia bacterium]
MVSQDNRLLPLSTGERAVDRPLDSTLSRGYGYTGGNAEANVRDYLKVVLKRKWLILTLMLVVTSIVTIQMYRLPSIYEAVATIQIDPKRDNVLKSGKEIVINTGNQRDPAYWSTQLKLLESPKLARQVAVTLDLQNNPQFFGSQAQAGIFASLRRIVSPPKAIDPASIEKADVSVVSSKTDEQMSAEQLSKLEPFEDAIRGGLSVEPVTGTTLVNLHFVHTDPVLASKVVNTMADVFAYNNLENISDGTKESAQLLAQKIAELQLTVKRQEEQKLNFVLHNNLPTSDAQGANLTLAQLNDLSRQLLDAQNDRKNVEALYESAAKSPDPMSIPEVASDKRIQTLRDRLDLLNQKEADLLQTYTREWPEVQKVEAQINLVKKDLEQTPKEIVASLKSRYESAKSREDKLRSAYQGKYGESTTQSGAAIQLGALSSELETNKQYLQTLLARMHEIENLYGGNTSRMNNVSVPEPSRVPRAPIGPARMRNVVIAFLMSLGAGIGLAFLLDYLDDTLKTVDDVDKYIHLPALALIPSNKSERLKLRGRSGPQTEGESNALALIDDVRSPIAEAYRHLRTSLLLSSAGQPPKTILVTSSQPSEGKTTTAVNTAVMLAQTGAEVVILDCDLRRPRLHSHFALPNLRGVTNFLSGESDLDSATQTYERLQNLKIMTSGPVPPNPAELLGSDEMRRLLALLGERFSHIIIDSPPAISFTDASILSTLVDGVMLVVHGGRSSRAVVRRAKQQLLDVGAHIFGVVLNNVKLESTDYYYYPGYYSNYYSNDQDDAPDGASGAGAGGSR